MLSLAALNLLDLCWFILARGACQPTEEEEVRLSCSFRTMVLR